MKPFFSIEVIPKDPLWKLSIAAVMIDKKGFDGIWVSDHFFNRNSLVTLSLIALNTRKVMLGPAVVNPYLYHPITIAQAAATLWELAPRRVRLAIGAGDRLALKKIGIDRKSPVEKVMEAVEKVKDVLNSQNLLETYNVQGVKVFVGAQGRRMLENASKKADGVLVNWSNLDKLIEAINFLKPLSPKDFWKAAYVITSIHEDENKARKTAIPFAAYLMAGADKRYLEKIGIEERFRQLVEKLLENKSWDELYNISSDSWVDEFVAWGKPKKLEEMVSTLVEKGYDEVVFAGPLGPRYIQALKYLSSISRGIKGEWARGG